MLLKVLKPSCLGSIKMPSFGLKSLFIFLGFLIILPGCESGPKTRPFGVMRLGRISEFKDPEIYLKKFLLVLRRDEKGFSAMSTQCPYDATPLVRMKAQDGKYIFVSQYSESQYSYDGAVLHGPTRFPLPYYELELNSGELGGPRDTLYAKIAVEVPPEWRLKVVQ